MCKKLTNKCVDKKSFLFTHTMSIKNQLQNFNAMKNTIQKKISARKVVW